MQTKLTILREWRQIFRSCVCPFDSMAISNEVPKCDDDLIDFTIVSTGDDDIFIEDLFYLGKMFGSMITCGDDV